MRLQPRQNTPSDPPAVATTWTGLDDYCRKKNGGGKDPDQESILAPVWKFWAQNILNKEIDRLDQLEPRLPQDALELSTLKRRFSDAVTREQSACAVILEYSPTLNKYPVMKTAVKFLQ